MPRRKRGSRVVEYAEQRLATLQSIRSATEANTEDLDLKDLKVAIDEIRALLNQYNGALSIVDQLSAQLKALERALVIRNDRLLSAVNVKYGRDSTEYRQVRSIRLNPPKRRAPDSAEVAAAVV
jgi:hypothetical protein